MTQSEEVLKALEVEVEGLMNERFNDRPDFPPNETAKRVIAAVLCSSHDEPVGLSDVWTSIQVGELSRLRARVAELERYSELGRACEGNGLAGYGEDGEMWFQPPADLIAETALSTATSEVERLRAGKIPNAVVEACEVIRTDAANTMTHSTTPDLTPRLMCQVDARKLGLVLAWVDQHAPRPTSPLEAPIDGELREAVARLTKWSEAAERFDPEDAIIAAYGVPAGGRRERHAKFRADVLSLLQSRQANGAGSAEGRSDWICGSCDAPFKSAGGKIVGGTCPQGRPTCPLVPA